MHLSVVIVKAIIAAGEQHGIPADKSLSALGMKTSDLSDMSMMVLEPVFERLLDAISTGRSQPFLGLALARLCAEPSLHLFGQLLLACPSFSHAADILIELGPAAIGGPVIRLNGDENEVRLELEFEESSRTSCFMAEFLLSVFCGMALRFAGPSKELVREVQFQHGRHDSGERPRSIFGVEASFGQHGHSLVLDPRIMDRNVPGTDLQAALVLRRVVQTELIEPRRDKSWAKRAAAVMSRSPELATMEFASVARELGVSLRTLRRRLKAEGATLTDLQGRLHVERARSYLGQADESIKVVAEQLGYSETSAFHRAFKRLTGMTPKAYRRHIQPSESA